MFHSQAPYLTAGTAQTRNRFVAALADAVLIAHAQPGSKSERLARELLDWGLRVCTLQHPANEHLLTLGLLPYLPAGAPSGDPGRLPAR